MDAFLSPWLIWFVIGIGLAFLELQLPGFVVIFFGIGCLITAAALLVWDPGLDQQILIFLVGSVSSLLLMRKSMLKVFSRRLLQGRRLGRHPCRAEGQGGPGDYP